MQTATATKRLAMWSGPRNISTAMMRSFGNRPDAVVCDEPLYAHYLRETGYAHPAADLIIEHHEADWQRVADWLTGPLPEGKTLFYQKHMTQHMLPHIGRDWLDQLDHAFLIRDPLRVILSYNEIIGDASLEAIGLPQQVEIFERVIEKTGAIPPVVDSQDIQAAPESVLRQLCEKIEIEFTDKMLNWPPGPRATDGVWGPHWYEKTYGSTWFRPVKPRPRPDHVPPPLAELAERAEPYYRKLWEHRITP